MVETKVWAKQEYVNLMSPYSKSDFERLKKSIKKHGGLLVRVIINQECRFRRSSPNEGLQGTGNSCQLQRHRQTHGGAQMSRCREYTPQPP